MKVSNPPGQLGRGFGARLTLHRVIWAVGALLALLTLATALTAFVGLRATGASTLTLQTRQSWRHMLDGAQRDLWLGQSPLAQPLVQTVQGGELAGLSQALQQRQTGLKEWAEFKTTIAKAGVTLPGVPLVDADLTAIQANDPVPGSVGPAIDPSTLATAETQAAAALARLAADFAGVQQADDLWWAATVAHQKALARSGVTRLVVAAVAALLLGSAGIWLAARAAGRRDRELAQRSADLQVVARASEFEARLQRALEMASTEEQVYEVIEHSVRETLPLLRAELLLADFGQSSFEQLFSTGIDLTNHCGVGSPAQCPAAQRGQVLSFPSSAALDACVYLKHSSPQAQSATCLPVSVGGITYGVVHARSDEGELPSDDDRATLELVARRASDRIGMLRAFSRSELQASTDSLTGLLNRRTLESQAIALSDRTVSYAVAFVDLDHFKRLNDTYGHAAGDRALRLFAQVLQQSLRPGDLVGRYGGEEFVLVMPNCSTEEGVQVLERIRQRLAAANAAAGTPAFTVSVGLADMNQPGGFVERVAIADAALLEAKSTGRDRIVVAEDREHSGSIPIKPPPPPLTLAKATAG